MTYYLDMVRDKEGVPISRRKTELVRPSDNCPQQIICLGCGPDTDYKHSMYCKSWKPTKKHKRMNRLYDSMEKLRKKNKKNKNKNKKNSLNISTGKCSQKIGSHLTTYDDKPLCLKTTNFPPIPKPTKRIIKRNNNIFDVLHVISVNTNIVTP